MRSQGRIAGRLQNAPTSPQGSGQNADRHEGPEDSETDRQDGLECVLHVLRDCDRVGVGSGPRRRDEGQEGDGNE